ncbi:MAG: polyprenol monophosphomannose synthase [Myxococcales bacterium]|nr:polyprenol monophosphomannose synthase [Myxococcales bacterium]
MTTLIITPTYNESENIKRLVSDVHGFVPECHILIVDDNSPDGTGDIADALSAEDSRIHVLHRAGKLGLGTAYIAGFKYALEKGYETVQEMDADFSHQPKYLPDFQREIEHHDLVLGSRYVPGGGTENWGLIRQFISRGGNFYARAILGLGFRDLTGGFKCFRRHVLEAIDLDSIRSEGYAFQIECTYRAHKKGFSIKEIPIVFPDRTLGKSKMSKKIVAEAMLGVWRFRRQR